ncbi:4-alpha-glucanotransferase [candidate division KSB1 bacterium]|nr:4-alpha-glucanotransferase [candidate division KSB1 bacterium]
MKNRAAGILCHITSLPSPFGIGDFGPHAFAFIDYLHRCGLNYWQILPLTPTNPVSGNSPYSSASAFAGNPLLISPDALVEDGLLDAADLATAPPFPEERVDFSSVIPFKFHLLHIAFTNFCRSRGRWEEEFAMFCSAQADWLEDTVAFRAFKIHFDQKSWVDWPEAIKMRHTKEVSRLKKELTEELDYGRFIQFIFDRQWTLLRKTCNEKGIRLIGDIPYYVNHDSADVWSHRDLFQLDDDGRPLVVAGVPPDYFSAEGQLWGNPIYNWEALQTRKFDWWLKRLGHNLYLYDIIRFDHFRGLVAYWEVEAGRPNAVVGQWVKVPVVEFLQTVKKKFPDLPIIAEDLGVITPDVEQVMKQFQLPGMKVLQFAFDESLPHNAYAPHNHIHNCVLYVGTHDNDTAQGWFSNADESTKSRLGRYIGKWLQENEVHWDLIRMGLASVADLTVLCLQDLIGLGTEAKMNTPGTLNGNWGWRVLEEQLKPEIEAKLHEMLFLYGRLSPDDSCC